MITAKTRRLINIGPLYGGTGPQDANEMADAVLSNGTSTLTRKIHLKWIDLAANNRVD